MRLFFYVFFMNIEQAIKLNLDSLQNTKESKLAIEILLAFIIKRKKEYIFAHSDEQIGEKDYYSFKQLLQRLKNGEPTAYIINQKEFYGLEFYVDKRVLIPRPETEMLVDITLEIANTDQRLNKESIHICDVGAGSGNVSIALAKNNKRFEITSLDVDQSALEVSSFNVTKHKLQDKIDLLRSDLFEKVRNRKFDIVVANLPYIGTKTNNYISVETQKYEPEVALYGGEDGLSIYSRFFDEICNSYHYPYYVVGEIGFSHGEEIKKIIKSKFPNSRVKIHQDLAGFDRCFTMKI